MTWLSDIWDRARYGRIVVDDQPSELGMAALDVSEQTLGWGESGGNNRGADVEILRDFRGPRGPWCAAAVSYWLRAAAMLLGLPRRPARIHNAKRLFRWLRRNGGRRVEAPLPGDVVLWHRGAKNSKTGHIGIVVSVDLEAGTFVSREGNKGRPPAAIADFSHALDEGGLIGFVRP